MSLHGRDGVIVDCSDKPSMTVQSDRSQANINNIMKKMEKGHMLDKLNQGTPFYGDVTRFKDLQESIIQVQEAQDLFMDMSADIRKRFNNDPVEMVQFLDNSENQKEAEELGMVIPKPKPEPIKPGEPSPPAIPDPK